MKKSNLLVLGLIALMLAGGLALASCGGKCPGGLTSDGKGKCSYTLGSMTLKDCDDLCVSRQTTTGSPRNLSCDC